MAGAARYDLFEKPGKKMPDNFDELVDAMKAVHNKDGVPGFLVENHYGWSFIPFLQGFGGNVFRKPARRSDAGARHAESDRSGRFFCQSGARLQVPVDGELAFEFRAPDQRGGVVEL
jgi:hypothetical protein